MASSSSFSPSGSVTKEEFNAFHKSDRALFSRLVLNLGQDIANSLQIMSFLLYLEKSGLIRYLIVNLVSLPDNNILSVVKEVMLCLKCLSYEKFSTFAVNSAINVTVPLITRMTGGSLTLEAIHQDRENILVQMNKHLTGICQPAFEDICNEAEMRNKMIVDLEKTMEKMKQVSFNSFFNRSESSNQFSHEQQERTSNAQFLSEQQERTRPSNVGAGAEDRTVFITFSRGYPISEREVYDYFTGRHGDIIETIIRPPDQVLFANIVLRSAEMVPVIVSDDELKNRHNINGKQARVRKFTPRNSIN